MALYILGDPHLSFSVNKPMDIFGERWKNHAEKIKENWLSLIKSEDTVILAGDLSWAISLEEARADFEFLHQLPGHKILLRGNHDYWWDTLAKMQRFFDENEWSDFSVLQNNCIIAEGVAICGTRGWGLDESGEQAQKILRREGQRLEMSLKSAPPELKKVVVFHYPPVEGEDSSFLQILKKYQVGLCYYGHLHGPKAYSEAPFEREGIHFRLISCDALAFKPHCISDDLSHFEAEKWKIKQNSQKILGFFRKVFSIFKSKC